VRAATMAVGRPSRAARPRLVAAGKPKQLALVAALPKLLVILKAMLSDGTR
jgi:hypothetical protein